MTARRPFSLIILLTAAAPMLIGCVSRDEYLREKFARRKAVERAETLERDLADERARVMALEAQFGSLKGQLNTQTAMTSTLKAERDRLSTYSNRLQTEIDSLARQQIGAIKVVEVKLPAELDRQLKDFASRYPDSVEYDAERGAVRWKSDLTFAKGSDDVQPDAADSLRSFAQVVNSGAASGFEIIVVGHTDNLRIGPVTGREHPTNWHLSVHRAIAVMNVLAGAGVPQDRMGVMGYGEFRPRVDNTRGGAEENRRVEIYLVASRDDTGGDNRSMADSSIK
ncbi:MAG TPA: OmpA family protein [Phycisphaerae bacterium]|nr:OmpA family protein [Phycisphaerae bacterium]HRW56035.1 OmpA family protein [Phycisphaerae bacterium]